MSSSHNEKTMIVVETITCARLRAYKGFPWSLELLLKWSSVLIGISERWSTYGLAGVVTDRKIKKEGGFESFRASLEAESLFFLEASRCRNGTNFPFPGQNLTFT